MRKTEISESYGAIAVQINAAPFGGQEDLATEMNRINEIALEELTPEEVYVFQFELSNTNVDAYYTRMTVDSLMNYEMKINKPGKNGGVPLLGNHNGYTYPVGRIYSADLVIDDNTGVNRLVTRAYILRGDDNEDVGGDAIIKKIRGGVQNEVSIGFIAGNYRCSICGKEMVPGYFSRAVGNECSHMLGEEYEGQVCYAWVEDGIILEGSLVSSGATPEAFIQKAINMAKNGMMTAKMVNSVNKNLHTHITLEKESDMKAKELLQKVANGLPETVKANVLEAADKLPEDATPEQATEVLATEVTKLEEEVKTQKEENARLAQEAELGKTYKNSLVEKAIEEGVAVLGEKFNKEAQKRMLDQMSVEDIQAQTEHYLALKAEKFGKNNLAKDEETDLGGSENEPAKRLPVSNIK